MNEGPHPRPSLLLGPPAVRTLPYLPVAITIVVGLATAAGVFIYLRGNDFKDAQIAFESDARVHVRAFERGIESRLSNIEAAVSFITSSWPVKEPVFQAFMGRLKASATGSKATMWAPRVPQAERESFEQAMAEGGAPSFRIHRVADTPESESPEPTGRDSFPIAFVTPPGSGESLVGIDLATAEDEHRAIALSQETGKFYVLSGTPFIRSRYPQGTVLVIMPAVRAESADGTALERPDPFLGVVAALIDVGEVLEEAVGAIRQQGLDTHCYDLFGNLEERLLCYRPSPQRQAQGIPVPWEQFLFVKGIRFQYELHIGTRRWAVLYTPAPEYVAAMMTWRPWIGSAVALGFTVLLVLYFFKSIIRTEKITALVRQRTSELETANERLRIEIAQRKKFEAECDALLDLQEQSNTALERANTRLEQSNDDLQKFAFVVSHDLKEPLRKIRVFCDRLLTKTGNGLDERGREYVGLIQETSDRMEGLIADLLQISRVTTHGASFSPTDLAEVIADAISNLAVRIEETGARIDMGPMPIVDADPTQMRQLFQNLLDNSLKYRKPNVPPEITVSAEVLLEPDPTRSDPDGRVGLCQITVRDNGLGFDQHDAAKVFALFQRLANPVHAGHAQEGSGIGLAVCRRIAERHGGAISVRARKDEGACFFVTVPVRQVEADSERPNDAQPISGKIDTQEVTDHPPTA